MLKEKIFRCEPQWNDGKVTITMLKNILLFNNSFRCCLINERFTNTRFPGAISHFCDVLIHICTKMVKNITI